MVLPKLLESPVLKDAMKSLNYKKNSSVLKVLDCTYVHTPPIPFKIFKKEYYGKFDKLIERMSKHKFLYLREHIPGAIFFDICAAFYTSESERFASYEPKIFEKYAQLLSLNSEDHLVFYGRGESMTAMLFAAKVYWLFKSYGHKNLSILNGGLNSWKNEYEFPVESYNENTMLNLGSWEAQNNSLETNVTFEELNFQHLENINLIDARTRPQFEGNVDSGLDSHFVQGSNILGTKNIPAAETLLPNGKLKSDFEIKNFLQKSDLIYEKPTYVMCMVGMQASLMAYVLELQNIPAKLYNGGLYQIGKLEPKLINGGKYHTD